MSIRLAIANASKEALGAYLAPELVEQLTEEIVVRASAELEGALAAFTGFDLARPNASRNAPLRKTAGAKRQKRLGNSPDAGAAGAPPSAREPDERAAHEATDSGPMAH